MKGKFGGFILAGLALSLFLAFFISSLASSQPDGLNKVAIDQGFDSQQQPHALENVPTAGYGVVGINNSLLSTGLAGVVGVLVTFLIGLGLFSLVRVRNKSRSTGSRT